MPAATMATSLVFNPQSGSYGQGAGRRELLEALEKAGLQIQTAYSGGGDPRVAARDALAQGAQVILAAGGDGTISSVASVVIDSGATLGVLPFGTLNHFAKDLGIPTDLAGAAQVIANGRTAQVDIGEVNGYTFINNSSLGAYPQMVLSQTEQRRNGRRRALALALASLQTLKDPPFVTLRVRSGGKNLIRRTPLIFVGNNTYEVEGLRAGSRECLNRGHLFICDVRASSSLDLLRLAGRALVRRLRTVNEFESMCVTEAVIETPGRSRAPVSLDGEVVWMHTPLHYRIHPGALRVLVP